MRTTAAGHVAEAQRLTAVAKAKLLLFREGAVTQTPGDLARSIEADVSAICDALREADRAIHAAAVRVQDQAERASAMLTPPAPRGCRARGEAAVPSDQTPTTRLPRCGVVVMGPAGDDVIDAIQEELRNGSGELNGTHV